MCIRDRTESAPQFFFLIVHTTKDSDQLCQVIGFVTIYEDEAGTKLKINERF